MFGRRLLASIVIITQLWGRPVHHEVGAAAAVSSPWIPAAAGTLGLGRGAGAVFAVVGG